MQNDYEFPNENIADAINPVFSHIPFDPGRIPRGGAGQPRPQGAGPGPCQHRAGHAARSEARGNPGSEAQGGPLAGPGARSLKGCSVWLHFYDFICVFIVNIDILIFIKISYVFIWFWMISNESNQILATLNQVKIQLNQVSALLINLNQVRDLFQFLCSWACGNLGLREHECLIICEFDNRELETWGSDNVRIWKFQNL